MVLYNANVVTMDPTNPRANVVAIENGRIAFVGYASDGFSFPLQGGRVSWVDCQGGTVIPGFHDAHIHLEGMAAAEISVDCSPANVGSIREIQLLIAQKAKGLPPGHWIRCRGYHETNLADYRHPTRYDLDVCAPFNPVKLTHQSGHASVLNSCALELLGIDETMVDMPGTVIERNTDSNIPNGVLLEMEEWLSQHMPSIDNEDRQKGIRSAKDKLLSWGVTSFQDATATNDLSQWDEFTTTVDGIGPPLKGTFMLSTGVDQTKFLSGKNHRGQYFPRLGHTKVMVTATAGSIHPELPDLVGVFQKSHQDGVPLAVHAVELEEVAAVLEALRQAGGGKQTDFFAPHRFEHCPESPDWVISGLKELGIGVVVNPGFIYYNGDRYLQTIAEDVLQQLYPFRSMVNAQLTVAAGSDSPVVPADPIKGIYGAVFRKTRSGSFLNPGESLSVTEAMYMYTIGAAKVTGLEHVLGSLMVGKDADLVVLSQDPWSITERAWEHLRVWATIVDGNLLWSQGFD